MDFKEMSDNQRRVYIDTAQLYEAYLSAYHKGRAYRGGMHWKKAKGREYLFRSRDRYGYGKSLGPRSQETEKILKEFRKNKQQVKERLENLKDRLKEQARFCKAAMIQRVPRVAAETLRLLDRQKLLGRNVLIVGTNALYAYEAAAGAYVDTSITATGDPDILWDVRSRLTLVADNDIDQTGLLDILRKADRSFELSGPRSYRAINRDGYMVDLIKSRPKQMLRRERTQMGGPGDLKAAEIKNLHWLISSPKVYQIVIGEDGFPAAISAPDPRAFALHKLLLSKQTRRAAVKKQRAHDQAIAVANWIVKYLPQYEFKATELRMFPKAILTEAEKDISELELPSGFDTE
ncbi:MAG: GSU2403 family nucleotidyltransferase fold protein [Deltaproteobacteria bacterium]|nr:GSU2403 family nucleotidyltransferase fold protein [Deltaproteobacteria bacterium]